MDVSTQKYTVCYSPVQLSLMPFASFLCQVRAIWPRRRHRQLELSVSQPDISHHCRHNHWKRHCREDFRECACGLAQKADCTAEIASRLLGHQRISRKRYAHVLKHVGKILISYKSQLGVRPKQRLLSHAINACRISYLSVQMQ